MRDNSNWSWSLGRWGGAQVRLHAIFVFAAVFIVYFSYYPWEGMASGYGPLRVLLLFVGVLAHEFAHAFVATRVGGASEWIVLAPWGSLTPPRVPREPHREAVVAIAGPLANLVLVLVAAAPVLLLAENEKLGSMLCLVGPPLPPGEALWLTVAKLVAWENWLLCLVNLLPALPFDGGRMLQTLLWPNFGTRSAAVVVSRFAQVTAIALLLAAWFDQVEGSRSIPWLPITLLAVYLVFNARHEVQLHEAMEGDEDLLGYDFSQGYTSLERQFDTGKHSQSSLRRWLETRREAKREKTRAIEIDEERRVDEILARLHDGGLQGLSAEERALLERVSARYRSRHRP